MGKNKKSLGQMIYENSLLETEKILKEENIAKRKREEANICFLEMQQQKENRVINEKNYFDFLFNAKEMMLSECIYKIYRESNNGKHSDIGRNLINTFIKENGVNNILNDMATKNIMLSELSRMVEAYYELIQEDTIQDSPDTYNIAPEIKSDFKDSLEKIDTVDVSDCIKIRVGNAIEEFISANTSDRYDIQDVLKLAQEKIESLRNPTDEIKEAYQNDARRVINKIRDREKGVFYEMVNRISKKSFSDKTLKEAFTENGKLEIDKIVESTEQMYRFVELLNSTGLAKIDEAFISNMLEELN